MGKVSEDRKLTWAENSDDDFWQELGSYLQNMTRIKWAQNPIWTVETLYHQTFYHTLQCRKRGLIVERNSLLVLKGRAGERYKTAGLLAVRLLVPFISGHYTVSLLSKPDFHASVQDSPVRFCCKPFWLTWEDSSHSKQWRLKYARLSYFGKYYTGTSHNSSLASSTDK